MINNDTICALSTPPGQGAIAVIRISGPEAFGICDKVSSFSDKGKKLLKQQANTVHFGKIKAKEEELDEVVYTLFRSPHSYTGEDIVEISCHGSVYIQQKILEMLVASGARLAKPGEFTMRAFLNGKMDLSQAEGVADLIASGSAAAHRLAFDQMRGGFSQEINNLRNELLQFISLIELELDFSEEDVEFADRKQFKALVNKIEKLTSMLLHSFEYGNAVKNGIPVALIGRTNSGKSTLLNRLLREDKAIVSEIAGTTRDFIEDTIILKGMQFRFIDTAGLRHTADKIESEGIQRTHQKYKQARIVIVMADVSDDPELVNESVAFMRIEDNRNRQIIFAMNKTDLLPAGEVNKKLDIYRKQWGDLAYVIGISAKQGDAIDELEELLLSFALKHSPGENEVVVTNVRHFEALSHAEEALQRILEGMDTGLPTDLIAQDVREVLHYLGEITGEITTDEILGNIFRNFCIGK